MFKRVRPSIIDNLDENRYSSINLKKYRSKTITKLTVDLLFYIILSIIGYIVLKDKDYLSIYFFGKG